ncbi:hypothetical protein HPB50_001411 [Hyalomma asiaticum]|uniref:Uncharacterized protein n=1 Tax=Hyalomma asiaticum TaxID=266040 RepID=A0ACB7RS09_HYAAI|nr:hypothetical protein HPB50_001411 [Hyalomma asiaticum]
MADFVMLLALAGAMFVGSYMSGMVPLSVPLTEARLHLVSVFGAGLLVGTALSVIIPEGISTLYLTQISEFLHDLEEIARLLTRRVRVARRLKCFRM